MRYLVISRTLGFSKNSLISVTGVVLANQTEESEVRKLSGK